MNAQQHRADHSIQIRQLWPYYRWPTWQITPLHSGGSARVIPDRHCHLQ